MIEAIKGPGVQRAKLVCDICARSDTIACSYDKLGLRAWQPSRGQALVKARAKGWAEVKGKLHCPACEAKRKATPETKPQESIPFYFDAYATMAEIQKAEQPKGNPEMNVAAKSTEVRRPTPKQERLIMLALENAYDDKAQRYKGKATDKTIADELADGIMFGWVAEIRERYFGPSGGNEEIEAIRADIAALKAECDAKVAALNKRIDAMAAAVGPRARAV